MNKFIELTILTTHEGSDLVSDLLWQYTDLGVAVSDIQDVIDLEKSGRAWDYADESIYKADKTVIVKAYIPFDESTKIAEMEKQLLSLKENCPFNLGTLETSKREIDGDLWREQWKEHFKPIHIGKVVIVPEWIDYKPQDNEIKILLDSNMAFGTGEHETTSMCVEMLAKYVDKDDTVLDVDSHQELL